MFKERGIILRSALADNVKVTLAIWEREQGEAILCKPTIRKRDSTGALRKNTNPYKAWLNIRELMALTSLLERAAILMDEHAEGTINLKDLLAEDPDARLFTGTESVMYPTIEGMFDMTERLKEEQEED